MRRWSRAVPAVVGAVVLTVALTGCNGSGKSGEKGGDKSGSSSSSEDKTTFKLGEASPTQTNDGAKAKGKWTVTPTKVETGTVEDMENSGLEKDKKDGPQVPVFVSSTLKHQSGDPMEIGDMNDDLIVKTDKDKRTRELIVLMGDAKWKNCPTTDTEKKLKPGDQEKICGVFLVPEGQKPAAVELSRGFNSPPLEWPVKG
ncbi:hypothetical protein OIE63_20475 [Streptomyces sp. NBC_01795]|uniref:hypothetical protein n=1 Tax=unclassified Streptomyces TaxID=2593676 RepID=UPI002DDA57CB|nr:MULTISPECIES: hypothetical protein [unclassified Streptomyces]WSA93696.1 hypothetical protein OIE63_20475 [Streptomyces sp. NBC_01795]WSS13680.1 hypothetical protein OG533_18665 [Streptomyces sp. NBC_01186]